MNDAIDSEKLATSYFNDIIDQGLEPPQDLKGMTYLDKILALQIGNGSKVFRSDESGIWLGAKKFADAPFSVDMLGAIKGTSGTIAGWVISSTTLSKNNAILDSAGQLSLGTANDIVILSAVDTTYRIWIGNATAGSASFSVTKGGSLYSILGTIGGWVIGATSLTSDTGAVGMSSLETGGIDIRFWAGHATPASAPFQVDELGALTASSATITGSITATSGTIGSFTIGTYLYTGTKTAYNDTNAGVHLGSDGIGIGNNVFTVSSAGAIVATSATVTGALTTGVGSSINCDYLTAGTITVGGTAHPTAITIGESSLTGNARLGFEHGSRIWEDSSSKMGMNAIGGEIYFYCNSAEVLYLGTGNVNIYQHLHVPSIVLGLGASEGNIENVDIIKGYNDLRFQVGGGQDFKFLDSDGHENAYVHGDTGRFESSHDQITLGGHTLTLTGDVSLP